MANSIMIWERLRELASGLEHISKQLSEANIARDRQFNELREMMMALHASTEAKLQELGTAIADELTEIKNMITAGNDPAEINARLDAQIAAVKGMSDALVPTSGPADTGETGSGGSGEGAEA